MEHFNDGIGFMIIFFACLLFIILPIILNFVGLVKSQRRWQENPIHSDRYQAWLGTYGWMLYVLSFVSGSTFGAVELYVCLYCQNKVVK